MYNNDQIEADQNTSPLQDLDAEFPGIIMLHDQPVPQVDNEKNDDNKE